MKIDAFMPFYGSEFFNATKCLPDDVIAKYIRAIWYYWSQNKCKGLPDDDAALRRICECDASEWPSARDSIFNGEFFAKVDDLWHQKRCQKEYAKAVERSTKATLANESRWRPRG